ncbi:oligosaccharide biosynthesis protein Alg14 like protein [Lindgomyces ingoldianus]|uniref:Oligosaccharide biosynthesis protein Alg14 like protein n=1 Tax=Lindgomyces ingoldianus TaxID=673940 RepID=A0ACB6QLP1_9PLEO|nr:oligosaccharide biosynthesis protein Alg14 like protein [Lindgomyces ingoldianus]KAF2467047.1 oligosaccharide biosynthesis protein Alg14 like protein [Lindgomyces ingoldianus]
MAPPPASLWALSFFLALLVTLFVAATLRLLSILPHVRFQPKPLCKQPPVATRILIILGSGGHTHEMFYLLRDLDTSKYTHRTYVVSSGDAFSAQRAVEFEQALEQRETVKFESKEPESRNPDVFLNGTGIEKQQHAVRTPHLGPENYNIAIVPRARKIHQSLFTTPFTSLHTLLSSFPVLLSSPPLLPDQLPQTPYEAAARDLPDLVITNGPATAVILVLASLILKFFNIRGAQSRGKMKSVYVESFARVKTLSLSGRLLVRVVDRFLVQWEELEGKAGRAEYCGILV